MLDANVLEEIEIGLLLEGVFRHYGVDFRNYSMDSLKRRIRSLMAREHVATISGLQEKVLHDRTWLRRLSQAIPVSTTSMFRNPRFFLAFRLKIIPLLRTYPFIRVWIAGCSTGEEAYSMAILLHEEGLYERSKIYATDMSEDSLKNAEQGGFPKAAWAENARNYLQAGGRGALEDYCRIQKDYVSFNAQLKRHLVFAEHNLVTDSSFNEFTVVLCRNVLIYFNRPLQAHVHKLLFDSLVTFGFLGLGNEETLKFTPYESRYAPADPREKLFRKVG